MTKRRLKPFREVEEEYFRNRPEEIAPYIDEIFDEYAKDGNSAVLLSSLRVIAKVKGISVIAEKVGLSRQGVQHALSSKGNPRFDSVNAIMRALGYRLVPEPLHQRHILNDAAWGTFQQALDAPPRTHPRMSCLLKDPSVFD